MGWLSLAWHFVFGWAGIDMLIGFAAVAVAVLLPKQLDFVTDLRKWAIATAVVAFTLTGAIAYGYQHGSNEVKRQWDAALVKEAVTGEQDRVDADHDVDAAGVGGMRDDPRNRDNWKRPGGK